MIDRSTQDADRREDPANFSTRFKVDCSTAASRFQFLCHTEVEEESMSKFIKGNKVVRLQHTEIGGYLTSDDLDFTEDGLAEVYVRCYNGGRNDNDPLTKANDIEEFSSGDLFEIEIAPGNHNRGKICLWSDSKDKEGITSFRFRHMNSGRLVKIQDVVMYGKSFTTLGLSDHIEDSEDQGKHTIFGKFSYL